MRDIYESIHLSTKVNGLICRFLFFLFLTCSICFTNNSCSAANVEDSYFGIKFKNVSEDFKFELPKNDSAFTRIYFSSKTDKFAFIVYASRGNLKHSVTDKYDSIFLSKYYQKPDISQAIEEYSMKGTRNIYKYKYYNKEVKRYVDEFLTYDILYKPYFKSEEYFYLIYSYTTTKDDSRVDYFRSLMQIEPPKISFWKTTFGTIMKFVIAFVLAMGFYLFGNLFLRKVFYNIKNGRAVLEGYKKKNELYDQGVKEILKLEPNANEERIKQYFDKRYYPFFQKKLKKSILVFSSSIIAMIVINIVVVLFVYQNMDGYSLLGYLAGEIALILFGSFGIIPDIDF